jgi:predicted nucleotide-binding protein
LPIPAGLINAIKKKSGLEQAQVYRLITAMVRGHAQPRRIAALMVARDKGVNLSKYASDEDLAEMRSSVPTPAIAQALPTGAASLPRAASTRIKARGSSKGTPDKRNKDAVFLVHGRDDDARKQLETFLTSLHINVIDWSKALVLCGKPSPYVGEVIDAGFANAQAIVVLMTPDDVAYLKNDFWRAGDGPSEKKPTGQPRQNVLFEAGMAFAKGRDRTVIVDIGKNRPMSDVSGIHAVRLNNSAQRRKDLVNRLKMAGVELDESGDSWLGAGNFEGSKQF